MRGKVTLRDLDVGALSELSPGVALSRQQTGRPSERSDRASRKCPWKSPSKPRAELALTKLTLSQGGVRVRARTRRPTDHDSGRAARAPRPCAGGQNAARSRSSLRRARHASQGLGRAPTVDAVLALQADGARGFRVVDPARRTHQGLAQRKAPGAAARRGAALSRRASSSAAAKCSLRGLPAPITRPASWRSTSTTTRSASAAAPPAWAPARSV